jgi:signal transduction histidine kinase
MTVESHTLTAFTLLRPQWLRPPRRLLLLVVAIGLGAAAALGWLGWRLLDQDRALESQHIQERLDATADLVGAALVRKLAEQDDQLTGLFTETSAPRASKDARPVETATGVLTVTFDSRGVLVSLPSAVRYYPFGPADDAAPASSGVSAGDVFEFQQGDRGKAIAAFREQARTADLAIKAGALLGVARNLQKSGQATLALAAYADLAGVGPIPIAGVPADLLARHARCGLLEVTNDLTTLKREASALYADLQGGRWQLTRGQYLFHAEDTRRWSVPAPDALSREDDAIALSGGVDWLWDEWQRVRAGNEPPAGRHSLWINGQPVLVLWRSTPDRLVASVIGRSTLHAEWETALVPVAARQAARVAVTDDGHLVLGQALGLDAAPRQVTGRFSGMRLPWTVEVSSADPAADLALLGGRRRLLFAGFAFAALLLATGGYVTARAVSRELAVARLQSDFVSAVSHEFRTPLATMRQLSELLADGRVANEANRQDYYEGLRGESERLSRLVEDLLDFGRMDAGAREYRFQPVEPATFVRTVAAEFRAQARAHGYHIEIAAAPALPDVRGDREALGRALWNLLDNAVKYSPESKTIWVEAVREGGQVAIRVRDEGVGIAGADQRQIFKKFVRTSSAKAAGITGTGLGLTMVQHIVSAHGGEVRVNSTPGAGSAFTILLPVSGDAS